MASDLVSIGRVAPVYQGAWSSSKAYGRLDIVANADKTIAYIARKAVPAGIALTSTAYWAPVLDVSALIAEASAAVSDVHAAEGAKARAVTESASGNPVVVEPDAGSWLRPNVEIGFVQSGSGDPSPGNIRPITAPTQISITRTGKNMLNCTGYSSLTSNTAFEAGDDGVRIYTTADQAWAGARYPSFKLAAGTTVALSIDVTAYVSGAFRFGLRDASTNTFVAKGFVTATGTGHIEIVYTAWEAAEVYPSILVTNSTDLSGDVTVANAQIEVGDAVTAYEPYQGNAYTVALGGSIYGGTLDAATGVLTIDRAVRTYDGEIYTWYESSVTTHARFLNPLSDAMPSQPVVCSHAYSDPLLTGLHGAYVNQNKAFCWNYAAYGAATIDDLKAYLVEQYNAGTPVQVVYKLAEPLTVQLTATAIEALDGLNTMHAGGRVTLNYNSSMPQTIADLSAPTVVSPVESARMQRMLERVAQTMIPAVALLDLPKTSDTVIGAGAVMPGINYSSVSGDGRVVGTQVPVAAYYSALENPASKMYTEWDYTGDNASATKSSYYGLTCSSFVSYALGLDAPLDTVALSRKYLDKVVKAETVDDLFDVRRGDIILNAIGEDENGDYYVITDGTANHCRLVRDVVYDAQTGKLVGFNVSESWKPYVRNRLRTPEEFLADLGGDQPYHVVRPDAEDYSLTVVPVEYSKSVYPDKGDKATYSSDEEIWLYIPDTSATSVSYAMDGGTATVKTLSSWSSANKQVINGVIVYKLPVTDAGTYTISTDTAPDDPATIIRA